VLNVTFTVAFIKIEGLMFWRPSGWRKILGSLGLKMVKTKAMTTTAMITKKTAVETQHSLRPLREVFPAAMFSEDYSTVKVGLKRSRKFGRWVWRLQVMFSQ
jgi:hypothetical protein